jgi:hypothetical protein
MTDRPSGFSAVMNQRATTDPESLDYFPTPPWAARAGGELIRQIDPGAASCWEPACGERHMAHALADYFPAGVACSDIHDYGGGVVRDFLDPDVVPMCGMDAFDWIVTNPPFNLGEAFVRQGLKHATRGVAMLLRLNFLEGQKRFDLLFGETPISVLAPFAERVPMVKGRWDPNASTATAYAWFIWVKGWSSAPLLMPIAPGARARLTRASDQRFARAAEDPPLFGGNS